MCLRFVCKQSDENHSVHGCPFLAVIFQRFFSVWWLYLEINHSLVAEIICTIYSFIHASTQHFKIIKTAFNNVLFSTDVHNPLHAHLLALSHIYDKNQRKTTSWHIWLSVKRCTNGGLNFWLSIKSVWKTLSCCCFVCAFIIGQYHTGNNMSSKSGAAGEIFYFESEKCHGIRPLKTDPLTVSVFDAFIHVHDKSKHSVQFKFSSVQNTLLSIAIITIKRKFFFAHTSSATLTI